MRETESVLNKGDSFKDDTKISSEKIIQAIIIYFFDSVCSLMNKMQQS